MKVLITNQCATNKGDRAVLYFILRELVANGVKDITVSTTNPYYWKTFEAFNEVNVKFVPFGWNLSCANGPSRGIFWKGVVRIRSLIYAKLFFPLIRKKLIQGKQLGFCSLLCNAKYRKAVKDADVVIGTGGHRVTTLLSKEGVFSATYDMAFALLQNKPLYLWSQTIGPFKFENPQNKQMFQRLLEKCAKIYIRDENSREAIKQLDVSLDNVESTIESVFGLYDLKEINITGQKEKVLGVSVYMAQRRTPEEHKKYIQDLAEVVDHAAAKGYSVKFFPMEMENQDRPCIQDIINQCKNRNICSVVENYPETPEHMRGVSECRIFMGHKTHSVVFALTVGTPLLAIAYHKKTEDFMRQFGLLEYSIDDAEMNGAKLIKLFDAIEEHWPQIRRKQLECARVKGSKVKTDFAEMLSGISN